MLKWHACHSDIKTCGGQRRDPAVTENLVGPDVIIIVDINTKNWLLIIIVAMRGRAWNAHAHSASAIKFDHRPHCVEHKTWQWAQSVDGMSSCITTFLMPMIHIHTLPIRIIDKQTWKPIARSLTPDTARDQPLFGNPDVLWTERDDQRCFYSLTRGKGVIRNKNDSKLFQGWIKMRSGDCLWSNKHHKQPVETRVQEWNNSDANEKGFIFPATTLLSARVGCCWRMMRFTAQIENKPIDQS